MALIYIFDKKTGEYLRHREGRASPLEKDVTHVPKGATLIPPPEAQPDKAAVFAQELNQWQLVDDFRGAVYYDNDGKKVKIVELEETVPEGAATEKPPGKEYSWSDGVWVIDADKLAAKKLAEIGDEASARRGGDVTINGHPVNVRNHLPALRTVLILLGGTAPLAPGAHGGAWVADDKVSVVLSDAQMLVFATSVAKYSLQIEVAQAILEDAVKTARQAADPVVALQAIDPAEANSWPSATFES
jgi:hypothetical protein